MTTPAMICNMQYRMTEYHKGRLTEQQKKKQISTKDMYKYYDRDDACDKTICTKDSFDYYDYRVGSTGGFNDKGSISAEDSYDLTLKYKPSIIYRMVLSFTDKFAQEHNLKPKKNMQRLIQKSMNKNLREMGFDPDNVEWSAYYHTNTKSPHVHIAFYEKVPTRRKPTMQQKRFQKVRSNIYSNISHNIEIYIERDDIKKRLIDRVKQWDISDEMKKVMYAGMNNHKSTYAFNSNVINGILKLEKDLPKKGSMKYNSKNIKPYHEQIKGIIDEILNDEKVNDYYQEYLSQLQKEVELQESIYGSGDKEYVSPAGEIKRGAGEGKELQSDFLDKKLFEIETQLGNMILQNILSFREDMGIDEEEEFQEPGKDNTKGIRERKRNVKTRQSIINHGAVHELSQAIQESYYAQVRMQQMQRDVISRAKEEIQGRIR